jgi:hypothetical protein
MWFDAVVLESSDGAARVWEPLHGEVVALLRDASAPAGSGTVAST